MAKKGKRRAGRVAKWVCLTCGPHAAYTSSVGMAFHKLNGRGHQVFSRRWV